MCSPGRVLFVLLLVALCSSCASIVSRSNWPFTVQTEPAGANVSITNRKGVEVYNGSTPATLKLRSGSGFFGKETYIVTIASPGYATKKVTVECKVNGWYFGNILLGGIIGMLIIDPATGAMYQLASDGIYESLKKENATGLRVIEKSQVPEGLQSKLVKIN